MTCAEAEDHTPGGEAPPPAPAAAGEETFSDEDRWSKFKQYSTFRRTCQIWGFVVVFFFRLFLVNRKWAYRGKQGFSEERMKGRKEELATWLRESLIRLGPTFIKIGQQFSTRVDVLSPEFIKELEKLQDNVPPFSSEVAMRTVEKEVGPVGEKFQSIEPQPIAAASLGQVHKARLADGTPVVVKVQRPGLKDLFDVDLKNIRAIAKILQAVDPKTDGAARDWVAIYDECSRILYQEIDYNQEAEYAQRFSDNFADTEWVRVPKIYWDLTTPQILTMEYAPGVKINNVQELDRLGIDRARIARLSVECYLQQILKKGLFHADPHPGNIAVDPEDGGKLIFYDFGMMGSIPTGVRSGLLGLFYAVYKKNADAAIDSLVTMGVLVPGGDMTAVKRTARFFLDSFAERLKEQREQRKEMGEEYNKDFKAQRTKDEKKEVRKKILANIGQDLLVVAADQPFRFPALFTFVVRAFSVLDGLGKSLDPKFDISEIAAPYARDLVLESKPYARLEEEVKKRVANQNRAVVNLFRGPNRMERVEDVLTALERGDLKLRVRALEAERSLERMSLVQGATMNAVLAGVCLQVGQVVAAAAAAPLVATASYFAAGALGFACLGGLMKVKKLEKKEKQLSGAM